MKKAGAYWLGVPLSGQTAHAPRQGLVVIETNC